MNWFNFKRTCVGNPCSNAKPAETFSPSTRTDYQCEFALYQQLTTVRLVRLSFKQKDQECWFNLLYCRFPSPPVPCVVSAYLLKVYRNSVVGHMQCRRISEVMGLLPEISSGGHLKTFSIHQITPILQDDTDNKGNYKGDASSTSRS